MTDRTTMLIGTLLRGDLTISASFRMAAELTELLNKHKLLSRNGQRETSLQFLQLSADDRLSVVPGVRLYAVQASAIGLALAGALAGTPILTPFPKDASAHDRWRQDLLMEVRMRLAGLDAKTKQRALDLIEATLDWDTAVHPEPTFLYRTLLHLSALTTNADAPSKPIAVDTEAAPEPLPVATVRPSRRSPMLLVAGLIAAIMLLVPLTGSTEVDKRAQLTMVADAGVAMMVNGNTLSASDIVLPTGRHRIFVQDGSSLHTSSFDLTEDTTCTWRSGALSCSAVSSPL